MVMTKCCQENAVKLSPIDAPVATLFLRGLGFFDVVEVREWQGLTEAGWKACHFRALQYDASWLTETSSKVKCY